MANVQHDTTINQPRGTTCSENRNSRSTASEILTLLRNLPSRFPAIELKRWLKPVLLDFFIRLNI
jgi:hypothetical protein